MAKDTSVLQSSDGESFKVEESIENQSAQMIEDNSIKNLITKKSLPSTKNKLTMSKKTTALQSSNGEAFNVEEAITKTTTSNELTMSKKMIVLQSFDGDSFKVEEAIARQSKTISLMIEDDCNKDVITLENVTSKILAIVIEYCKKHHVDADSSSSSSSEEDLKKWDAELMEIDQSTIFQIILASNYLNIKGLHDLTCQTVADMINGKTPDQIRKHFKITNDFTREEEKQIYEENQWVFE